MSENAPAVKLIVAKGGSFANDIGIAVQISYLVPWDRIASLMVSFVESGDPVTRGWCSSFQFVPPEGEGQPTDSEDPWYAHAEFWARPDWEVAVTEMDGEATVCHKLRRDHFGRALSLLAAYDEKGSYRWAFDALMADDADAPAADIFMQMACFGEEKYA